MLVPILLPDLGTGEEEIRVSSWLIEPGERTEAADRVVEVLIAGMTFDVPAPVAGRLISVEKPLYARVSAGDTLGWLEPDAGNVSETSGPT